MIPPSEFTRRVMAAGNPGLREIGVGSWEEEHPDEPRPIGEQYDEELLNEGDRRNVMDRYRYWSVEAIKKDLDERGRYGFEVAVENWTHDFNIGSIVRTANAFTANAVHIIGPKKWNRKGSLMTELYQHVHHHASIDEFIDNLTARAEQEGKPRPRIIALDIVPGAQPIERYDFPENCVMIFGAEGPGLTSQALERADDVVYISQTGSVRSLNAGAAAAVAMHTWVMQHGVIG
ncbi:RNA methyltransferase, TrmH family [Alloscardovia omnicolens]|uniref:TrmH family RNA methyltransferase n=1 Tax=Alloscardovia omnicolens TaxID=419015 RepID=UPI0006661199|nr:TrmH family RNA methyltransferase [Alloscardovia omnicolens]KWZ75720.1 RNA methyltransferase, TrmH family [Alloscardovia omnicolens]MDK8081964.1 TrmH family RNA methyltransferase [Alloscardovia omnicolens]